MRFFAVIVAFTLSCSDAPESPADAGVVDASMFPQGQQATGELAINEVAPRNGAAADWIEIVNRSNADVDLCNYFLADSLDRLDHYLHLAGSPPPQECPPSMLSVGDFRIIYADDEPSLGTDHASFKLGSADEVHLITTEGLVIDSLFYLFPEEFDYHTLARQPSRNGPFFLATASQGADNPEVDQ